MESASNKTHNRNCFNISNGEEKEFTDAHSSKTNKRCDNSNNLVDSLSHMFSIQDVQRPAKLPKKYDDMVMLNQTPKKRQRQISNTSNSSSQSSLAIHCMNSFDNHNPSAENSHSFISYSEIPPENVLTTNYGNIDCTKNELNEQKRIRLNSEMDKKLSPGSKENDLQIKIETNLFDTQRRCSRSSSSFCKNNTDIKSEQFTQKYLILFIRSAYSK